MSDRSRFWLQLGGGAALLGLLAWWVDLDALRATVATADPAWVVAALLLLPVNMALEWGVWHDLMRGVGATSWKRTLRGVLAGYTWGFVTPLDAGEYGARVGPFAHLDRWTVGATVAVQRMADLAVGLSAGGLALAVLASRPTGLLSPPSALSVAPAVPEGGLGAYVLLAVAAALGVGGLGGLALTRPDAVTRLLKRCGLPIEALRQRLQALRGVPTSTWCRIGAGTGLRYGVYIAQLVLLLWAFAPTVSAYTATAGAMLTFLLKYLAPSLSLLDLGVREGAAVLVFGMLGISASAALSAAFLLFVLNRGVPALVGVPAALSVATPARAAG